MRDWLNAFHGYVQYTHDVTEKELQLIRSHGSFFDDLWAYWMVGAILKRRPIWMKQKSIPMEKLKLREER